MKKYKIVRISKIATGVGFIQNLPEGQYSEKICETLFDTGNDKEDAANSEKYSRLICDALNEQPSTPTEQDESKPVPLKEYRKLYSDYYDIGLKCDYWKKRCEAAERIIDHERYRTNPEREGFREQIEDAYKKWQQLKFQKP